MKILSVIFSLNFASGGPISWLRQYRNVLTERGHQIDIVSPDDPADPVVQQWGDGVYALGPGIGKYKYTSKLVPWLKEHHQEYDKVIVHGIWQFHSFAVWRALHKTETPYYVFTHGMLDPWFKRTYPLKHLKKWMYWPWAEYRVLRDAASVFFTCEEERRLASQSFWLYQCHENVINYGSEGAPDSRQSQACRFLELHPDCKDKHCIIYLGRIHEKKGCDLLLKAFARQRQHTPDAHLIMAGPCDQPEYLQHLKTLMPECGSSVTWTGMLAHDLKWGALCVSKAFVLPSHQENFGVAVVEALSSGLPVLISDQVNIWREISQHGAGIVANDTQEGTEELLKKWFELSPAEQNAMSDKALKCFAEYFEIHQAVDSFYEAIQSQSSLKQIPLRPDLAASDSNEMKNDQGKFFRSGSKTSFFG